MDRAVNDTGTDQSNNRSAVPIRNVRGVFFNFMILNSRGFQVEVYASGRSLVQSSSTCCGVFECNREASVMRRLKSAI